LTRPAYQGARFEYVDLGDYRRSGGHDDRQETEAEIVDQDGAYRRIHGLAEPSSGRVVCVTRVLSVRAIA
jgi:hypothetical protein